MPPTGETPRVTEADQQLVNARRLAADERLDEAAEAYRAAQELAPAEAAEYLGAYAVRRQRWAEAAATLEQAARLDPANLTVLEDLGVARERVGAYPQAREALQRVLEADPDRFVARLALGFAEHRLGHPLLAMAHMYWAFQQAQHRGFWLDSHTVQPWLQDHVHGAAAFITRCQQDLLQTALAGADGDVRRVETFIRNQLGLERQRSPDPRQVPKKHYFPGLPPSPWFDPALFPWARRMEQAFPEILAEYLSVASAAAGSESFGTFRSAEQVAKYLGTTGPAPAWNAFFFYRHGVRHDENCRRCPRTAALLDELPLIRLPGATPEICFSTLTPGRHILPHRGDSNLRSVVHLGLVVPPSSVLKVAGEERSWAPGKVMAFDDTYEHEAWNRSDATRAVLLMDAWNPHLTEVERAALPRVIGAMAEIAEVLERLKPAAAGRGSIASQETAAVQHDALK